MSPVLQDFSTLLLFLIDMLEEDCQSHLVLYWVLIHMTTKVLSFDEIIQSHFLLNPPLQNKWMTWQNQKNQMWPCHAKEVLKQRVGFSYWFRVLCPFLPTNLKDAKKLRNVCCCGIFYIQLCIKLTGCIYVFIYLLI